MSTRLPPQISRPPLSRREAMGLLVLGAASTLLGGRSEAALPAAAGGAAGAAAGSAAPHAEPLRRRAIPHSGELLPVVGLGTAIVFDVAPGSSAAAACAEVVRNLVSHGGSLIDTAPSYGQAESVVGAIVAAAALRPHVFLATKLERYDGHETAGAQESLGRLHTSRVDLLQLHNVRDPSQDLGALRALKARGLCRYTGITTTFPGAHAAAEAIVKREQPDFLEIDYAIDNRAAEARVIPAAADAGTAVIAALPFGRGRLFRAALGHKLPGWAAEIDCRSWAQFFLKYILANPAVTAVIPGTDKPAHMVDDLGAGLGVLPDAAMRARMARYVESLS